MNLFYLSIIRLKKVLRFVDKIYSRILGVRWQDRVTSERLGDITHEGATNQSMIRPM